tara:strand:- start:1320 stop:2210 length:891 start_codon:yes stop_codon:yes gene_type:complete
MKIQNLLEARAKFRLHPSLDASLYQITDNMAQVTKWRGPSYFKEMGDDSDYTIGYVMISLKDDTIIPIPRGDEHHRGYSVLYEKEFRDVNPKDYYPIFAIGNNYIFGEEDKKLMLAAAKKYFSYGGKDWALFGGNEFRNLSMLLSDFVKLNGDVTISKTKLPPSGQRIYSGFVTVAGLIRQARNSNRPSDIGKAFLATKKLLDMCHTFYMSIGTVGDFDKEDWILAKNRKAFKELKKNQDIEGLEQALFGFGGLKNSIHAHLKTIHNKPEQSVWDDNYRAMWGEDLELAINMLAQI